MVPTDPLGYAIFAFSVLVSIFVLLFISGRILFRRTVGKFSTYDFKKILEDRIKEKYPDKKDDLEKITKEMEKLEWKILGFNLGYKYGSGFELMALQKKMAELLPKNDSLRNNFDNFHKTRKKLYIFYIIVMFLFLIFAYVNKP